MAVKHVSTSEVHKGQIGGATACGFDTTSKLADWEVSFEKITCLKNGCK
ncbi:MAG: hypothetical protein COB98_10145 [Flavobacteriaceae bacterium]|nr:MAG: hypothetical protein COB98_10145 [Flavobacteriaceae bacterium]